jgi:uncharacterized membrane protein (DUF106 family)
MLIEAQLKNEVLKIEELKRRKNAMDEFKKDNTYLMDSTRKMLTDYALSISLFSVGTLLGVGFMENTSGSVPASITKKQAIGILVLGGITGAVATYYGRNSIENDQIRKIKDMSDVQFLTEYEQILSAILSYTKSIQDLTSKLDAPKK